MMAQAGMNPSRRHTSREDHEYMDVKGSDSQDVEMDVNHVFDDDDDENDYNDNDDGPVAVERIAASDPDAAGFVGVGGGTTAATSVLRGTFAQWRSNLAVEIVSSAELVFFRNRLNVLMLGGVVAVVGDTTGLLGEAICFCLSGLALIPCAERLSFLTELVAEHTNGTIGALLNATFGNAPELLISIAALRSGFYRVVQLAMLGSILTNMMLVFGIACLIGGLRWQVQVLRLTSGNVSVVMLLVSTAGFLFPAALLLSGQFYSSDPQHHDPRPSNLEAYVPTHVEISFGRVNAAVMMILYLLFLLFTLGTHQEEFDSETLKDHSEGRAQRNLFCLRQFQTVRDRVSGPRTNATPDAVPALELRPLSGEVLRRTLRPKAKSSASGEDDASLSSDEGDGEYSNGTPRADHHATRGSLQKRTSSSVNAQSSDRSATGEAVEEGLSRASFGSETATAVRRNGGGRSSSDRSPQQQQQPSTIQILTPPPSPVTSLRMKNYNDHLLGSESPVPLSPDDPLAALAGIPPFPNPPHPPALSMSAGIFWLFVLTLCISALSDILVDTIDGFAQRMNLSQVFTSMVIVPFFSNVAEQVSAFLFAYRNEMDLVVGVTIGSAIQIASFVLPGSVLIGMIMDRSMTLYFRAYETVCMLFGVIVVGAVLQGGTTNWLVGAVLVGIYIIMATGIWYHELENLSVDGEDLIRNATYPNL